MADLNGSEQQMQQASQAQEQQQGQQSQEAATPSTNEQTAEQQTAAQAAAVETAPKDIAELWDRLQGRFSKYDDFMQSFELPEGEQQPPLPQAQVVPQQQQYGQVPYPPPGYVHYNPYGQPMQPGQMGYYGQPMQPNPMDLAGQETDPNVLRLQGELQMIKEQQRQQQVQQTLSRIDGMRRDVAHFPDFARLEATMASIVQRHPELVGELELVYKAAGGRTIEPKRPAQAQRVIRAAAISRPGAPTPASTTQKSAQQKIDEEYDRIMGGGS